MVRLDLARDGARLPLTLAPLLRGVLLRRGATVVKQWRASGSTGL